MDILMILECLNIDAFGKNVMSYGSSPLDRLSIVGLDEKTKRTISKHIADGWTVFTNDDILVITAN